MNPHVTAPDILQIREPFSPGLRPSTYPTYPSTAQSVNTLPGAFLPAMLNYSSFRGMIMIKMISRPSDDAPVSVTTAEAAWLTDLPAKTINATIDRGELPRVGRTRSTARNPRRLGPADVIYLFLRKDLSDILSATAKRELYEQLVGLSAKEFLVRRLGQDPSEPQDDLAITLADGIVRVELKRALARLSKRWQALRRAEEVIVSDPEIRRGEPVIKGTRVPAYVVADLVGQGADLREILEDYPSLNANKVRAALAFAHTHPRRGRPRKSPWQS